MPWSTPPARAPPPWPEWSRGSCRSTCFGVCSCGLPSPASPCVTSCTHRESTFAPTVTDTSCFTTIRWTRGSTDDFAGTEDPLCAELLERARRVLPALAEAEVVEARFGLRPVPADGHSCVGALSAVPGYYEAVTHSGVTLGPLDRAAAGARDPDRRSGPAHRAVPSGSLPVNVSPLIAVYNPSRPVLYCPFRKGRRVRRDGFRTAVVSRRGTPRGQSYTGYGPS